MIKKLKNKIIYLIFVLPSFVFADMKSELGVSSNTNFIKDVITSNKAVELTVKTALAGGVIYAIFDIGKSLLSAQGDAGKIWKDVGAIIFLGAVYYLLFMAGSGS